MSYSFSLQVREGTKIPEQIEDKGLESLAGLSDPVRPEMDEHIVAAGQAVGRIINSGTFGKGVLVNVSISGHAEPGHQKRDGWSQDTMSISLSQVQEGQ